MSSIPSYFRRLIGTFVNDIEPKADEQHASQHEDGGSDEVLGGNLADAGSPSGVATLNNNGEIPNTQIPPLAINETYSVDTESDLTTLSQAEIGDVGIVTDPDPDVTYILTGDYSSLSNWEQIAVENAPVSSVNGQVGTVSLTNTDVGAASDSHDNAAHSETYTTTSTNVESFSSAGASGEVPTAQGDGTLSMQAVSGGDTFSSVQSYSDLPLDVTTPQQRLVVDERDVVVTTHVGDSVIWRSVSDYTIVASTIPDSVASRPADNNATSSEVSEPFGVKIECKSDWPSIGARISDNTSGATRAQLWDSSQNTIQTVDISGLSAGDAFTFDGVNLDAGNQYYIISDADGADYTPGYYDSPDNWPYTSTDVDIIQRYNGNTNSDDRDVINSINDVGDTGF